MPAESKRVSWAWVTASRLLQQGECELLYANLDNLNPTAEASLRNGADANAEVIITLKTNAARNLAFRPPVPVYLSKGLFVDLTYAVDGIFVMWRPVEE